MAAGVSGASCGGTRLAAGLVAAGSVLARRQAQIDALNVFPVPDGDTGTNMLLTWQAACAAATAATVQGERHAGMVVRGAAQAALYHARGSSGLILSQFLSGAAAALEGCERLRPADVARALHGAAETARTALMDPVEGTVLTVMSATAEAAMEWVETGADRRWAGLLGALAAAARHALGRTPSQLEVLARAGRMDAGGAGLVALLDGLAAYAGAAPAPRPDDTFPADREALSPAGTLRVSEQEASAERRQQSGPYGYCTQFLIIGPAGDPRSLRADVALLGDAAQVVGSAEAVRVHVHTANPGAALSWAVRLGRLADVRVEDMQAQHDRRHRLPGEGGAGGADGPRHMLADEPPPDRAGTAQARPDVALHRAERPLPVEGLRVCALVAGAGFARACAELGADVLYAGLPSAALAAATPLEWSPGSGQVSAEDHAHAPAATDPGETALGVREARLASTGASTGLLIVCADAGLTVDEASRAWATGGRGEGDGAAAHALAALRSSAVPTSAHALTALLALRQGQTIEEAAHAMAAAVSRARWCDLQALWRQNPADAADAAARISPEGVPSSAPAWLRGGIAYAITSLEQAGARTSELISLFGGREVSRAARPDDTSRGGGASEVLLAALRAAFPGVEIEVLDGGQPGDGYLALLE